MNKDNQQRAIGFLGGTFDPIHFGHLRPALEISEALALQQLYLMPNHIAPHKSSSQANAKQRSEMVRLAIQNQPNIDIDTRELNRHVKSYTIDTLKELKKEHPNTPICFIMGMDSLQTFDTWHQWQEILNYCHLVISERPGSTGKLNKTVQALVERCRCDDIASLHTLPCGKIYFQPTSQLDISSTQIRQLLKKNMAVDFLLPDAVHNYIKQHHLYQLD